MTQEKQTERQRLLNEIEKFRWDLDAAERTVARVKAKIERRLSKVRALELTE